VIVETGQVVRCRKARGVFRVAEIHMVRGEVTCWGGDGGRASWRTFQTSDLLPARPGDSVGRVPDMAAPARKKVTR